MALDFPFLLNQTLSHLYRVIGYLGNTFLAFLEMFKSAKWRTYKTI